MNNLTDCINRQAVIDSLYDWSNHSMTDAETWHLRQVIGDIKSMPSVTPQEPRSFKWCTDCKEYDQEKHCCHRWAKVIRNTVEEMKQGYESEVLDKIRDQLKSNLRGVEITLEVLGENDPLKPKMEGAKSTLEDCMELIDKAETEDK